MRRVLAVWLGLVMVAVAAPAAIACTGARGVLYYSASDGSVRGLDVTTGNEVRWITASALTNTGVAHEIALDPPSRTLWFAGHSSAIQSINIDTLAPGRNIVVNEAVVGAGRHLVVDEVRRHVVTPFTNGSVAPASFCLSPGQAALLVIRLLPLPPGTYVGSATLQSTADPHVKTVRLIRDVG